MLKSNLSDETIYICDGEQFSDLKTNPLMGSPEVPYSLDKLKECEVTYTQNPEKFVMSPLCVFDMITGGKPAFYQYQDKFSCFLFSYTGNNGRQSKHDKISIFKPIEPTARPGECRVAKTIEGLLPHNQDSILLSDLYNKLGWQHSGETTRLISLSMLHTTVLTYLGITARLAHHNSNVKMEYWANTALKTTMKTLLPELEDALLETMVKYSPESGLFDVMLQGSRWMADHAFYILWSRNSYQGTSSYGLYAFFLVGVLGYQFSAFGSLSNLAPKLGMKAMEVLARIALRQSLDMMRAIKKRKTDLEEMIYPWYLMCHSFLPGFTHESSMSVFPVVT